MKIAVYPGTFDPITNGHADLLQRASRLFDKVIVAVAKNTPKSPAYNIQTRVKMIKLATKFLPQVEVIAFDELLVDLMKSHQAEVIIRGVRTASDFEYEFQLAGMNKHLYPRIETVFLPTSEQYSFISSSLVREVHRLNGDISALVHPEVYQIMQ